MAETLDYDIEGLYNALRTGEGGLPRRSERKALDLIKDDILNEVETTMGMSPEDVSYFRKNKTPEQIIEQFTTAQSRGGDLGAFAEGAVTEGVSARLSFPLAIKAGVAASNIVPPFFATTPLGLGTKATIGVLTGAAVYSGADKVIKDVILDTVADVAGLPGPKDERLPSERASYEAGRTFGGILGGGQALRGYFKKIPEEGIDIVFKNINSIKEKLRSGFKSVSSGLGKLAREPSSKKFIPDPYTRADIAAAGGASAAVKLAEEANPGGTWSRISAEIIGSFLPAGFPIAKTITEVGFDKIKNIGLAYVPESITKSKFMPQGAAKAVRTAKQKEAGNFIVRKLQEFAKETGEEFDAEKFINDLIAENERLKKLDPNSQIFSPGFITQNDALISLEKSFSQQNKDFATQLEGQGKERSIALINIIKALEDTGDVNAIDLAAKMYSERFGNLLEARLNSAVKAVDDAVDPFIIRDSEAAADARTQGAKIFAKNLKDIEDAADDTIDILWKKVSPKTRTSPTNTLKAYEEAIDPETGSIDLSIFTNPDNKIDLGSKSERFFRIINRYKSLLRQVKEPDKTIAFNDIRKHRKIVQGLARNESDPTINRLYTRIEQAMLKDMEESLIDPLDLNVFKRAQQATKIKNDIFERTFVSGFEKKDASGKLLTTPVQTVNKIFAARGDNSYQFLNDINTAVRIFSQESLKGVPVEGVDIKKLQEAGEKGIENLFENFLTDILMKRGVIKTFKTPEAGSISPTDFRPVDSTKTTETFVVDQANLTKFLNEPTIKKFFDLPSLAPLKEDLLNANSRSILLKEGLNYFNKISRQKEGDLSLIRSILKTENPEEVVADATKSLKDVDRLFKIVDRGIKNKAKRDVDFNPETARNAFVNNVISYLVKKSQPNLDNMNSLSFEELLDAPVAQLKDVGKTILTKTGPQTSLRDKLKQYGFFPKGYEQKLKMALDDYRKIENYILKMYGPEKGMSKDEAVDFFARYVGARLAPGDTIQVPAQFAKVFSRTLEEIPRTLLASKLRTSLEPGNIDLFIETMRAASPNVGKPVMETILKNFLGYMKSGTVTTATMPGRLTEFPLFKNETQLRIPIPKRKPPEEKVSQLNIPPRPSITAPPAQNVAQANLGPFDPAMAARFEQIDDFIG